jgi:hypothetical protein
MNDTALPGKNRHPVDQLANIRATQKILKDREDDLKTEIGALMGDADSLGGDEFIARQTLSERKGSLDEKAICKALGVETLDGFRKPTTTVYTLRVEARAMPEAT